MLDLPSTINFSRAEDPQIVCNLLQQAIEWMLANPPHQSLWHPDEVGLDAITAELDRYYLGRIEDLPIVTFMLDDSDDLYWPDSTEPALYVHRIAVARSAAAKGTGASVLPDVFRFAAEIAKERGKGLLRLDCDKTRPSLGKIYEGCGFVYHSDIQLPDYLGARYQKVL